MKKLYSITCLFLASVFFFFSCAVTPAVQEMSPEPESPIIIAAPAPVPPADISVPIDPPPVTVPPAAASAGRPENIQIPPVQAPVTPTPAALATGGMAAARPPERPVRPAIPQYILGRGIVPAENLAAFLLDVNPGADKAFVENLARYYVEEAAHEGVNHDVAFAQMSLETGFLRFGNLVTVDQNNFAGLGATGPGFPGLRFPNPRTGVRAQIQHLKAYATSAPLNQELVNPRYFFVRLGSSPTINGLAGTWAEDPLYAEKINNILERLYFFSFGS